jgi:hypothetical protein
MLTTGASSQNIGHLTSSYWLVSQYDVAGVFRLLDGYKRASAACWFHYRTSRNTESTPNTQAKVAKVLASSAAWS